MGRFRWGIISTGSIAHSFATALNTMPDAELVAVGSRTQASADAFADEFDIPHRHASYEALVNDPDVDIVYIGTPHIFHADNMQLALNAGKHVLCEKAFTINAQEAETCINLAREKNLFLMEALWMRFIPAILKVREWINDDKIGNITLVKADFNRRLDPDPQGRIYNLELGGGALLDVGIYPLSLAVMLLGIPAQVASHAIIGNTGVDEQHALLFKYGNGAAALLSSSVRDELPTDAFIKGTKGYIRIHPNFWHPTRLTLACMGAEPETIEVPYTSTGLNYEAAEVHACLRAGKRESAVMPLDETLAIMRLMDALRAEWGLTYPTE